MSDSNDILRCEQVAWSAADGSSFGAHGVDGVLRAGECWLIEVHVKDGWPTVLADGLSGVWEPSAGRVSFEGEDWQAFAAEAAAGARGRIGRVFASHAWLSNLDVDENITLAQRHHTTRPHEEIRAEMREWAQRVGIDPLPEGRPVWLPGHTLMLCQWVRALLGGPRLLLLEDPGREVSRAECDRLVACVARLREAGTGVVWIVSDEQWSQQVGVAPDRRMSARVVNEEWQVVLNE